MHLSRLPLAALTVMTAALALTACATTGSPANTGSATSSPTATPSETADASIITCDTILTDPGFQNLADDDLTAREYTAGRTDLQFMLDADGVACQWTKPSTDITAIVAQAPLSESAWATQRTALEAEGFVQTDDPALGFVTEPTDPGGNLSGGFLWHDGQLYYVSAPSLLNSIPALQE